MKYVLLFAGQGAQVPGMGRDLCEKYAEARQVFETADKVLGRSLSQVCFEGTEAALTDTSNCQPGIFVHSLAALAVLKAHRPSLELAACAGLSLGEFSAHTAAGTFSFDEGLKIVQQRGTFMQEACAATHGSMAALIGADEVQAVEIAREADVDVANYNSPGQIILSGAAENIARAVEIAKTKGIKKAIPLTVAGAYHSRLMKSAQDKLAAALAPVEVRIPTVPVVSNFTAQRAATPGEIRNDLISQVTGSVRWEQSMRLLLSLGHTHFIELGPGNVLSGLMWRIDKAAVVHTVSDVATLETTLAAL
ncbi:MAG: ACP S-malonyltransferase [Verrucomicrobiae bacterium]|nr:ACP S-malonyltransferase [Verrucomicrobiae bacterium]